MKIAIGADHAAYEVKAALAGALASDGHEIKDFGTDSGESTDYPDYAHLVAGSVASGESERGILLCGTGIGMCMTANKTRGVRAALVHDEFTTEMSRMHNNANVLCMGARVLDADTIVKLARLWLATDFEGGRHERRVGKMERHQTEK